MHANRKLTFSFLYSALAKYGSVNTYKTVEGVTSGWRVSLKKALAYLKGPL